MRLRVLAIALLSIPILAACNDARTYPSNKGDGDYDLAAMALRETDMPKDFTQQDIAEPTFDNERWATEVFDTDDPEGKAAQLDAQGRLTNHVTAFAPPGLGKILSITGVSTLYTNEKAAQEAIDRFACGLPINESTPLTPFVTPKIGDPLAYEFVPFSAAHDVEAFPAWAPNGRVVAYSAAQDGRFQIFTRSTKSWLETQVTKSDVDCMFPFWDADGNRIHYIANHNGTPALWIVNAAGGAPELVQDGVLRAARSPDGKRLATIHAGTNGESASLWIAANGKPPERYSAQPFDSRKLDAATNLAFSLDNSKLGVWPADDSGLWVLPMDGSAPAQSFQAATLHSGPHSFEWMPESRRVLYSDRGHLWIGDPQTGETSIATNGTSHEAFPSLSPRAREAAFMSVNAAYRLRSVALGGGASATANTTIRASGETSPVWSPARDEYWNVYLVTFDDEGLASSFTEWWIQDREFAHMASVAAVDRALAKAGGAA